MSSAFGPGSWADFVHAIRNNEQAHICCFPGCMAQATCAICPKYPDVGFCFQHGLAVVQEVVERALEKFARDLHNQKEEARAQDQHDREPKG